MYVSIYLTLPELQGSNFYVFIEESLTGSFRIIVYNIFLKCCHGQASKQESMVPIVLSVPICHFHYCCDAVARNSLHIFDMVCLNN